MKSLELRVAFICIFVLFELILYVPVNNYSVISRWGFLGWTSNKQRIMTQHSDSLGGESQTSNPTIPSLTFYQPSHCTPPFICIDEGQRNSTQGPEYKNLSWVWWWDRKICPNDHRLASWGLAEWWQKVIEREGFFYPTLTLMKDSYILVLGSSFETQEKDFQKILYTLEATSWWHNFNVTMTSRIDVQPEYGRCAAVCFLSFPWAGAGMWDRRMISHG